MTPATYGLKATVIAASLAAADPSGQVLLLPTGGAKRSHRPDVEEVELVAADDHRNYVLVQSPRESLYDMLPEGLFHSPALHKQGDTKAAIDAIKERRREEQDARRFFLPLEAEINRQLISMVLAENSLFNESGLAGMKAVFAAQWSVFELLDTRQLAYFIEALPFLHDLRDDHPQIEALLGHIFLLPFTIRIQHKTINKLPLSKTLGDGLLGIDLTTTGPGFYSEQQILIVAGPLTNVQYRLFVPGSTWRKVLDLLIDLLLPADLAVEIGFEIGRNNREARLAGLAESYNTALGMDTFL